MSWVQPKFQEAVNKYYKDHLNVLWTMDSKILEDSGCAIVLNEKFPPKPLCFVCASGGLNELIFCTSCCEPFHPYCSKDDSLMNAFLEKRCIENGKSLTTESCKCNSIHPEDVQHVFDTKKLENWVCRRCIVCKGCGKGRYEGEEVKDEKKRHEYLACAKCMDQLHLQCLKKVFIEGRKQWICEKCCKCHSCSAIVERLRLVHISAPPLDDEAIAKIVEEEREEVASQDEGEPKSNSLESESVLICTECLKRRKKGSYCPICNVCYDNNDYVTPMMECCKCEQWVHASCEDLSTDDYNILGLLDEVDYVCRLCDASGVESAVWKSAVLSEFNMRCDKVLNDYVAELKELNDGWLSGKMMIYKENESDMEQCDHGESPNTSNSTSNMDTDLAPGIKNEVDSDHRLNGAGQTEDTVNSDYKDDIMLIKCQVLPDFPDCKSKNEIIMPRATEEDLHNLYHEFQLPRIMYFEAHVNKFLQTVNEERSPDCTTVLQFWAKAISALKDWQAMSKVIFQTVMNKQFSWFDPTTCDMLIQPKISSLSMKNSVNQTTNKLLFRKDPFQNVLWNKNQIDERKCAFCDSLGDHAANDCGRLIWTGREWVHVNCALWSSEVYEDDKGSLKQINSALARSKSLGCHSCGKKGSSVSCCHSSCKNSFHFMCALKEKCFMMEDKKIYCKKHEVKKGKILQDLEIFRKLYVDLEWLRKKEGIGKDDKYLHRHTLRVFVGSLVVESLGEIFPICRRDQKRLIPVNYKSRRMHWCLDSSETKASFSLQTTIHKNKYAVKSYHNYDTNFTVNHDEDKSSENDTLKNFSNWLQSTPRYLDEYEMEHIAPCPISFNDNLLHQDTSVNHDVIYNPLETLDDGTCSERFTLRNSARNRSSRTTIVAEGAPLFGFDEDLKETKDMRKTKSRKSISQPIPVQRALKRTFPFILASKDEPVVKYKRIPLSPGSAQSLRQPYKLSKPDEKEDIKKHRVSRALSFAPPDQSSKENQEIETVRVTRSSRTKSVESVQCSVKMSNDKFRGQRKSKKVSESIKYTKKFDKVIVIKLERVDDVALCYNKHTRLFEYPDDDESLILEKFKNGLKKQGTGATSNELSSSTVQPKRPRNVKIVYNAKPKARDSVMEMQSFAVNPYYPNATFLSNKFTVVENTQISSSIGYAVTVNEGRTTLYEGCDIASAWRASKGFPVVKTDVKEEVVDDVLDLALAAFGLTHAVVQFLLKQLEECDVENTVMGSKNGCARASIVPSRNPFDTFSWLGSTNRTVPNLRETNPEQNKSCELPNAMRFRSMKRKVESGDHVYVSYSRIQGRGLFARRNMELGEMIIEYAGEVIRSVLTDIRERHYESRGRGCYMFTIDEEHAVDATVAGNAARFINHSCEPNCEAKIVTVNGKKHIIIFALRKIIRGEELTYDYKFTYEDEKIPCACGTLKCRKYMN